MANKDTYTPFQQVLGDALYEARINPKIDIDTLVEKYTEPLRKIILDDLSARLTALEKQVDGMMQQKHTCTCSGHIHDLTDAMHKPYIVETPTTSSEKPFDSSRQSYISVVITQKIIDYIEENHKLFDIPTPEIGEIWNVEREHTYPNVNNGDPVVEMNNGKGCYMRLPKDIISQQDALHKEGGVQ